jgi:hypothetical protein
MGETDSKGRTQQQWIQQVKQKFPQAQIIQSKMVDGPVQAKLPDGRTIVWNKVEQGVAEGLTYAQKHSSWSVQSPKKNEFNTPYKLDQEKEARTHAERIGGKLVKVDQHGHVIRAKKGVAEGELTPVPNGHKGLNKQQKAAGQFDADDKVSTGPILGHEPKSQKGLRGKLVGASESVDPLLRIKALAGK